MHLGLSPVLDAIKQIWLAETMTDRTRSADSSYYVSEPARSPLVTFPRSRDRPAGSRPEPLRRARRSLRTLWHGTPPAGGASPLTTPQSPAKRGVKVWVEPIRHQDHAEIAMIRSCTRLNPLLRLDLGEEAS